jgi:hypothetical protein
MEQTLMSLVGEHSQVMAMIDDPEVDQQTVLDTLDSIEGAIEVKADGYAAVLRGIKYEREGLNGKRQYLQKLLDEIDRRDVNLKNHEEAMMDRLMAAMIATGKDETGIKTKEFEFKIVGTGGIPKLEVDEDKMPEGFTKVVQKITPDNKKIREYLKDHECDWAWLLPNKKKLEIKGV